MLMTSLAYKLYDALCELPVIDAHEHLPAEAVYLSHSYSGLNMFAGGYIWHDLESAGMSPAFKATMRRGGDRPVAEWWPQMRLYWQFVRHTSYARALLMSVRDLYGIKDIGDSTIAELAERVKADNTPGLYTRILRDRCRIRAAITCEDIEDVPAFPADPLLRGMPALLKGAMREHGFLSALATRARQPIRSLDDASAVAQSALHADLAAGAIAFKHYVGPYAVSDAATAEGELKQALHEDGPASRYPALRDYLIDKCLDVAAQAHVPVGVHTGYWGDFRQQDPKLLFSLAMGRPDVRFDLFHLGVPFVRDAVVMGKSLPNVTLNLVWCAIISQEMTSRALDEIIDLVPFNKVIAFGGDYRVAVQKVYGHLALAREVVAAALARRIEAGEMDMERAVFIARHWFYENPSRIYGVQA